MPLRFIYNVSALFPLQDTVPLFPKLLIPLLPVFFTRCIPLQYLFSQIIPQSYSPHSPVFQAGHFPKLTMDLRFPCVFKSTRSIPKDLSYNESLYFSSHHAVIPKAPGPKIQNSPYFLLQDWDTSFLSAGYSPYLSQGTCILVLCSPLSSTTVHISPSCFEHPYIFWNVQWYM